MKISEILELLNYSLDDAYEYSIKLPENPDYTAIAFGIRKAKEGIANMQIRLQENCSRMCRSCGKYYDEHKHTKHIFVPYEQLIDDYEE